MNQSSKPPFNPYLADVIRTALTATSQVPGAETAVEDARIVVHGNRNVVAPGGVINILGRDPMASREST